MKPSSSPKRTADSFIAATCIGLGPVRDSQCTEPCPWSDRHRRDRSRQTLDRERGDVVRPGIERPRAPPPLCPALDVEQAEEAVARRRIDLVEGAAHAGPAGLQIRLLERPGAIEGRQPARGVGAAKGLALRGTEAARGDLVDAVDLPEPLEIDAQLAITADRDERTVLRMRHVESNRRA